MHRERSVVAASEHVGCGLSNLGNTCFMNSVLQCLAHTPAVYAYMRKQTHTNRCNKARLGVAGSFCSACKLESLVLKMFQRGTGGSFAPKSFADNLQQVSRAIRPGRQEDAHEFLRCLLELLTKHFNPMPSAEKKEGIGKHTVIQNWFQGQLQSTITCCGCGAESSTLDPFLDLSLELQPDGGGATYRSMHEALRGFTKAECLDGDNGYKCEACGRLCRATKQFRIHTPPKVLACALGRVSVLRTRSPVLHTRSPCFSVLLRASLCFAGAHCAPEALLLLLQSSRYR